MCSVLGTLPIDVRNPIFSILPRNPPMDKSLRYIVVPFLLASWLAFSNPLDADSIAPKSPEGASIGSKIDGFSLTDYQGKDWKLGDFQSKKAIVFAFIGSQCPLAKLYTAKLVELERLYRDREIAFVLLEGHRYHRRCNCRQCFDASNIWVDIDFGTWSCFIQLATIPYCYCWTYHRICVHCTSLRSHIRTYQGVCWSSE